MRWEDDDEFVGPPCEFCEGDGASCDCMTFKCDGCGERYPRAYPSKMVREPETTCTECKGATDEQPATGGNPL